MNSTFLYTVAGRAAATIIQKWIFTRASMVVPKMYFHPCLYYKESSSTTLSVIDLVPCHTITSNVPRRVVRAILKTCSACSMRFV